MADEGDFSGSSFVVPSIDFGQQIQEEEVFAVGIDQVAEAWEFMSAKHHELYTERLRAHALLRANGESASESILTDDGNIEHSVDESESEVLAALKVLEASSRRLQAAEAQRADAEAAMLERSTQIGAVVDECHAIAAVGGKGVKEVQDLQAREAALEGELLRAEIELDTIRALSREATDDDINDTNEEQTSLIANQLAAIIENLGAVRVASVLIPQINSNELEARIDLGSSVTLTLALDKTHLSLRAAHLGHAVVDINDILPAAMKIPPPGDIRLIVREARARLRRLNYRQKLVSGLAKALATAGLQCRANEMCDHITVLATNWSALFSLPHDFPDHPPTAAPRLHTLSVHILDAKVDHLHRLFDARLIDHNSHSSKTTSQNILDLVLDLHAAVAASTPSLTTRLPLLTNGHPSPHYVPPAAVLL